MNNILTVSNMEEVKPMKIQNKNKRVRPPGYWKDVYAKRIQPKDGGRAVVPKQKG